MASIEKIEQQLQALRLAQETSKRSPKYKANTGILIRTVINMCWLTYHIKHRLAAGQKCTAGTYIQRYLETLEWLTGETHKRGIHFDHNPAFHPWLQMQDDDDERPRLSLEAPLDIDCGFYSPAEVQQKLLAGLHDWLDPQHAFAIYKKVFAEIQKIISDNLEEENQQ